MWRKANEKQTAHGINLLGILKHRPFTFSYLAVCFETPCKVKKIQLYCSSINQFGKEQHPSFKIFLPTPSKGSTNKKLNNKKALLADNPHQNKNNGEKSCSISSFMDEDKWNLD